MELERILTIDRLAFGGEGVGRCEGKVVFVPGTAPGDRVRVRVLSDHGRFERAGLVEVLQRSPDRVEPPCAVFGLCGGCQWQHLTYEAQLRWKEEILRESILRVGKIEGATILPVKPATSAWNYRRRIRLKVDGEGRIGFYGFRSHEVVPFEDCRIADPRLNEKLKEIRSDGKRPRGEFELSLDGSDKTFFSQVHGEQNEELIQTVLEMAFGNADPAFARKKTVVELYAGSGNFTFSLAERVGQVVAVEENSRSVQEGRRLSVETGFKNIDWIEGTAEWGLKRVYRQRLAVDLLILDPPRRGAKETLDLIPLIRPRQIVYVSCDPVTLARDLKDLVRRHYRLEKIQPVDMFPQTYHIESVAQLSLI